MVYWNIHGEEGSFWMENCPTTDFPSLYTDLKVDTVILGGGIAGITTANLLKDLGHKKSSEDIYVATVFGLWE
jgi:hypothetical protein